MEDIQLASGVTMTLILLVMAVVLMYLIICRLVRNNHSKKPIDFKESVTMICVITWYFIMIRTLASSINEISKYVH